MTSLETLIPGQVSLAQLRRIYREAPPLRLADSAWAPIRASRETVDRIVASGRTVYGINTGFGRLAQTSIETARLAELQRNLVLSHSVGVGPALPDAVAVSYTHLTLPTILRV